MSPKKDNKKEDQRTWKDQMQVGVLKLLWAMKHRHFELESISTGSLELRRHLPFVVFFRLLLAGDVSSGNGSLRDEAS